MHFLSALGLFAAKVFLVVFGVAIVVAIIARSVRRGDTGSAGELELVRLNKKRRRTRLAIEQAILRPAAARIAMKAAKAETKALAADKTERPRVFVITFDGNVRASQTAALREELTAILDVARPVDEVVVRLTSPGGYVHAYGLAATQLERVRAKGLTLTAVVDNVAASGGYMMAVVASRIVAAPFSIIGSIGVVAGIPNFNRFLRRHDIDFEQHTAGKYKRTLTIFGENTEEGRQKFKEELEVAHTLFKQFIAKYRPTLDLDRVATGQHWYGAEAKDLGLIDALGTSDDYLLDRQASADVWTVRYTPKKHGFERAMTAVSNGLSRALEHGVSRGVARSVERAKDTLQEPPLV